MLVKLPAELDAKMGAVVFLQGMTPHYLAFSTYPLKPGDFAWSTQALAGPDYC